MISLSLTESLNELVHISTHSNLCYVYIAIACSHHTKVFLLGLLT